LEKQDETEASPLVFEWNDEKAKRNAAKHGVDFEEALTIFNDPRSLTFDDVDHSDDEPRYLCLGVSGQGRLLIAAFTETDEVYRLISCRKATARERKAYEKGT
jgi:uncharacterized DUF497 family protein